MSMSTHDLRASAEATAGPPGQRTSLRLLSAAVAVVVLACLAAAAVQDLGRRVRVRDTTNLTQNGRWWSPTSSSPATAMTATRRPWSSSCPASSARKKPSPPSRSSWRGVASSSSRSIPYAQGSSSSSASTQAATTEGYGMFAVVDYAANTGNLNYVDKARIGGRRGIRRAGTRPCAARRTSASRRRSPGSRACSTPCSCPGYVLSFTDNVLKDVRSNVGTAYAFYDEGAYRNELKNGDMRRAPEALRLVNSGLGRRWRRRSTKSTLGRVLRRRGEADAARRLQRARPAPVPAVPCIEATANQIEFFERVFGLESGAAEPGPGLVLEGTAGPDRARPRPWSASCRWRSCSCGCPSSSALVHPVPASACPRREAGGRLLFWGRIRPRGRRGLPHLHPDVGAVTAAVRRGVRTASPTWFFPQRMNNAVMLWAVLNGLVGFLLFFLRLPVPRHDAAASGPRCWGASASASANWRAPARWPRCSSSRSTACCSRVYYCPPRGLPVPVHGRARLPAGDARSCWACTCRSSCSFFLSNSFRVNGAMRLEGEAEWKSMLLAGVANSAGLLLIVIVQYATMAATGTVYWTEGWLYVNLLFAVVPMMFVLPHFNRLLLPADRADLPGADDHVPHLRDDPAVEHRLLPAALNRDRDSIAGPTRGRACSSSATRNRRPSCVTTAGTGGSLPGRVDGTPVLSPGQWPIRPQWERLGQASTAVRAGRAISMKIVHKQHDFHDTL
ncbi:MAG: hypothetical protein M0C28_23055 [Candidatus Moduliflexus flocculans]|nr:hypothetical protein [Candidatus Moduliflexus flocculans]